MTPRVYSYVGPSEIQQAVKSAAAGVSISSPDELLEWLADNASQADRSGAIVATFVVMPDGMLRLAPQRSEHVACASGGPVRSAGEMTFASDGEVVEVTNQSTGFCPEPESWPEVAAALDQIPVQHPGEFTRRIVFRRCPKCNERNLVKDDWFVCEMCGADLPDGWNFGDD